MTGLAAFPSAWLWNQVSSAVAWAVFATGIATIAQHLTEGDPPIISSILGLDGKKLVWIDRFCAFTTGTLIIFGGHMVDIQIQEIFMVVVALSMVAFCDWFIGYENGVSRNVKFRYLSLLHAVWHLTIFTWLWNRASILEARTEEK